MLENWAGVQLNTKEQKEAFCEECYASLYDRAFELSGSATVADKVVNQVTTETSERYAELGLPGNLQMYLFSRVRQLAAKDDSADAAAKRAQEAAKQETLNKVVREETKFDEQKTALWLPGEKFDNAALNEARAKANARPKAETNTRSVKMTIFNTILFLVMVGAAAFLAYELGVRFELI
nr:hypothetical protein [Clostridia bacterium]